MVCSHSGEPTDSELYEHRHNPTARPSACPQARWRPCSARARGGGAPASCDGLYVHDPLGRFRCCECTLVTGDEVAMATHTATAHGAGDTAFPARETTPPGKPSRGSRDPSRSLAYTASPYRYWFPLTPLSPCLHPDHVRTRESLTAMRRRCEKRRIAPFVGCTWHRSHAACRPRRAGVARQEPHRA